MTIKKEMRAFNFDAETIELLDDILQNIIEDDELNDEFKKLKFIKKLKNSHIDRPGPIKQLFEKMAIIEREFVETQIDMKRAVSDMSYIVAVLKDGGFSNIPNNISRRFDGPLKRSQHYSWNSKYDE